MTKPVLQEYLPVHHKRKNQISVSTKSIPDYYMQKDGFQSKAEARIANLRQRGGGKHRGIGGCNRCLDLIDWKL